MPLEAIDLTTTPGELYHRCAACDTLHRVRFDRAALETRPGPFHLDGPATILLHVDGGPPTPLAFAVGEHAPAAVQAKIAAALPSGVSIEMNGDALLIESTTSGPGSSIEFAPSAASRKLFHGPDAALKASRPVLGFAIGGVQHGDAIVLRPCGCGAQETLIRTWDVAPKQVVGTLFDAQRRAVNALAKLFADSGWVEPAITSPNVEIPPDIVALPPGERLDLV